MNWADNYEEKTGTLTIPYTFNDTLIDLPVDTKEIIFDENYSEFKFSYFNQILSPLPNSVTHLTFGCGFNQPLGHQKCTDEKCPRNLPSSLTHLSLGASFSHDLDRLPENLTHLIIGHHFDKEINCLPNKLTYLNFELSNTHKKHIKKLPDSLTHLICCNQTDNLPSKLTHLIFTNVFNQKVGHQGCTDNICPRNLPKSLIYLVFGDCFNQSVDHLPTNLTHLTFGQLFNQSVDNLPDNLTHLTFNFYFNKNIDHLPKKITHLTFGKSFNQSINNLPPRLTHLTLGEDFANGIDVMSVQAKNKFFSSDKLPLTLTHLTFSSMSKILGYIPLQTEYIEIIFITYQKNLDYLQQLDDIPLHIKEIKINLIEKFYLLKKVPFGCKIVDSHGKELSLQSTEFYQSFPDNFIPKFIPKFYS